MVDLFAGTEFAKAPSQLSSNNTDLFAGTEFAKKKSSSQNHYDALSGIRDELINYGKAGLAGAAEFGRGILNAPRNVADMIHPSIGPALDLGKFYTDFDYEKGLGLENPNIGQKLFKEAVKFSPYALAGVAAMPQQAAALVGRGLPAAFETRAAQQLINDIGSGALYGLTQSQNPMQGAQEGATMGALGGTVIPSAGKALGASAGKALGAIAGAGRGLVNTVKAPFAQRAQLQKQEATLADTLADALNQRQKTNRFLENAPARINELPEGILQKYPEKDLADLSEINALETRNAYRANSAESGRNYKALEDQDIRLDDVEGSLFQEYKSNIDDLLVNKENLTNLFGQTSFGPKIEKELKIAESFLNNKDKHGFTSTEMIKRLQDIGEMAYQAKKTGKWNESRILSNLDKALEKDFLSILESKGHSDFGNQLKSANQYHRENVGVFRNNPTIKSSALFGKVSDTDALAKAMHKRDFTNVLGSLSPEAKNAQAYDLLTKAKGTTEGTAPLTVEQLAKNFNALNRNAQQAIKQYNPELYGSMATINKQLKERNSLDEQIKNVQKEILDLRKNKGKKTSLPSKEQELAELIASKAGLLASPALRSLSALIGARVPRAAQQERAIPAGVFPQVTNKFLGIPLQETQDKRGGR